MSSRNWAGGENGGAGKEWIEISKKNTSSEKNGWGTSLVVPVGPCSQHRGPRFDP